MTVVIVVLSLLLAVVFLATGIPKITGNESARRQAEHLGVSFTLYRLLGWLELAAAIGLVVGLWWTWLAITTCAGLVVLMVGAVVAHRRAGDGLQSATPSIVLGVLALLDLILILAD